MTMIAIGFVALLVAGLLWARYSIANPMIGPDYIVRAITFAMLAAGPLAIAAASATELIIEPRGWWRTATSIALAAAVVMYLYQSSYMTDGGFIVLMRDIIASSLAVALFTLFTAGLARGLFRFQVATLWRTLIVFALTIAFTLSMPSVLLLIHCTSGDC
jgi:hypothetical protein